jgi:hypothetical protein
VGIVVDDEFALSDNHVTIKNTIGTSTVPNNEPFVANIPLPAEGPITIRNVTDVPENTITRVFNKKTLKLYTTCSVDKIVVNLSSKVLSVSEKELLSKGLTFCPTEGEPDFGLLWSDLNSFFRKLRIKHFFANESNDLTDTDDIYIASQDNRTAHEQAIDLKFRKKSNWEPPVGIMPWKHLSKV